MFPFFEKLFISQEKRKDKFFGQMKRVSELSSEIGSKKKLLKREEYDMILDKKDETYLSFTDFLELMDKKDLSIEDIVKKCHHISELDKKASVVELYSIVEDNHIVLCTDIHTCEKHKEYTGSKIRIVTMRAND